MRSLARLWPLLFVACPDRPLGESATDASTGAPATSTTATSPSTASDTNTDTTASPTTGSPTTGPGTSTSTSTTTGPSTSGSSAEVTTDPLTTGPSSTVTTDVSTSGDISTSGDPSGTSTSGDKLDLPPQPPPPDSHVGLVGCTQDAPPGTALAGVTVQGPFTGNRAYFGRRMFDNKLIMPVFMFLSPEAGTWELWEQIGSSGDIIHGVALTEPFNAWLGDWTFDGSIKSNNADDPVAIKIEITGFAGSWDMPDPGDPPRLLGNVTGEVAGPFDAVFCDNLNIIPPP